MKIDWIGHACFLITSRDGTRIVADPYKPGCFDNSLRYGTVGLEADAVTSSHDHDDHNAVSQVHGASVVLRKPGESRVNGVRITGVETFHDHHGGTKRGKNLVFVFEADGLRVAHLGDLGHVPDGAQLAAIGQADVVLAPVGGHFTIDGKEALAVAGALGARILVPMHVKTEKVDFPIAPVADFEKIAPKPRRIGSTSVEIDKASLPAELETWVLNHLR